LSLVRSVLTLAATLSVAACTISPPVTVVLPSSGARLTQEQQAAGVRWMANRGIENSIRYTTDGQVSFAYGGERLELSETEFLAYVDRALRGRTVASGRRGSLFEDQGIGLDQLTYFAPDGQAYGWGPRQPGISVARYDTRLATADEKRRGVVGGMLCFTWNDWRQLCTTAYDQLIGVHGRRNGDPFRLAERIEPSGTFNQRAWPDGEALFPTRAPHDASNPGLTQ
jgi:hypothetical protein